MCQTLNDLVNRISQEYGFVSMADIAAVLGAYPSFTGSVLVRCGAARFACSLQALPEQIERVESVGDYIWDISVPAQPFDNSAWTAIGYSEIK